MQFQADVLGVPVLLPEVAETTALGAAYLVGVGAGLWTVSPTCAMAGASGRFKPRRAASAQGTAASGRERRSLGVPWAGAEPVCDRGLTSRHKCGYIVRHGAHRGWSIGQHRVWFGSSRLVVDVQALAGIWVWDEGLGHNV